MVFSFFFAALRYAATVAMQRIIIAAMAKLYGCVMPARKPNNCFNTSHAFGTFSARKNIQQMQTKMSVPRMDKVSTRTFFFQSCPFLYPASFRTPVGIQRASPWRPPHNTKLHSAPCQSPPKSIVIIRFT